MNALINCTTLPLLAVAHTSCVVYFLLSYKQAKHLIHFTQASVTAHTQLGLIYLNNTGRLVAAVRCFSSAIAIDAKYSVLILHGTPCYLKIVTS